MNDTTLEELLATAAGAYDLPEDAFARVLEAAGESALPQRRRFEHPRLVAAGLLLVAAVGGAFLWSGHGGKHASLVGAGPAAVDFQSGAGKFAGVPSISGSGGSAADLCAGCYGASSTGTETFDNVNGSAARLPLSSASSTAPTAVKGLAGTVDAAKVVHTGSLALSVAKGQVTPTLTQLTGLATGEGGYVSSSTTAESGSRPSGTVVLRVPAAAYDVVLGQARALGTVVSTTSSAQDVTAQAADQQARLAALQASRDQFLTILAKAKTIGETLAVQQRVDDAQTQIDQLQGQIDVLANQASYGTLTVTVSQKGAVVVPPKPVQQQGGLSRSWHSAVHGFVTGAEALVARSGRGLLVLLVLVVCALVLRTAWRVGRRRLV